MTPRPTLGAAFNLSIEAGRGLGPGGMPCTMERITNVHADGKVEVLGVLVPVAGNMQGLRAGDEVAVGWQKHRPVVAIRHTARRSGVFPPQPQAGQPLIEELFIATRPDDGVADVYFRNYDQVTPLKVDTTLGMNAALIDELRWGPANDRFFIRIDNFVHIIKFDREPFTAFPPATDAATAYTRERIEDTTAKAIPLVTLAYDGQSNPAALPVTTQPGTGYALTIVDYQLDTNGALILSYRLTTGVFVLPAATPGGTFTSSLVSFPGQVGIDGGFTYPMVVDYTNSAVLFDGFTDWNVFPSAWGLIDYNGHPRFGPADWFDGSTPTGIARATSWLSANTWTAHADPPLGGNTDFDVTWHFGYSESPSAVAVTLVPIMVAGGGAASTRIRGWIAWGTATYLTALGQTTDPDSLGTFFVPVTSGEFPIAPDPPFPVTDQAGAVLRDPTGRSFTVVTLARPARGLAGSVTLSRYVYRQTFTVRLFTPAEGLLVGGINTPGFVLTFRTGTVAQWTTQLRTKVGEAGVNILPTDYAYVLDNAVSAPTVQGFEPRYFLDAWDFDGALTLTNLDTGNYPEDVALATVKPLLELPEGVTQPDTIGRYALQVVNDQASLGPTGKYQDIPTTAAAVP